MQSKFFFLRALQLENRLAGIFQPAGQTTAVGFCHIKIELQEG
jgi:hypothetical protein